MILPENIVLSEPEAHPPIIGYREQINFKESTNIKCSLKKHWNDYPSHWHPAIEIVTMSGKPHDIECSGEKYHLEAGDIAIISPGVMHNFTRGDGLRLLIQADISPFMNFKSVSRIMSMIYPVFVLTPANCSSINEAQGILREIYSLYTGDSFAYETAVYSKLLDFLYIAGSCPGTTTTEEVTIKRKEHSDVFYRTCDYLSEHYSERLTLEGVANMFGFSQYHFARLFRKYIGVSFYQYLEMKRIEAARDMLLDSSISVTEVAEKCGYTSLSAFIRMFKINNHCTPTQFRRKIIDHRVMRKKPQKDTMVQTTEQRE